MSWHKILFSLNGRINRKTFWIVYLPISFVAVLVEVSFDRSDAARIITLLVLFWPSLAVQVKRWHDRDKSGLWTLLNFIPVVGLIWVTIELGFLPGTPGVNRFDGLSHENIIFSCNECSFSVRKDDFKKSELFCPECGARLEVIWQ